LRLVAVGHTAARCQNRTPSRGESSCRHRDPGRGRGGGKRNGGEPLPGASLDGKLRRTYRHHSDRWDNAGPGGPRRGDDRVSHMGRTPSVKSYVQLVHPAFAFSRLFFFSLLFREEVGQHGLVDEGPQRTTVVGGVHLFGIGPVHWLAEVVQARCFIAAFAPGHAR